MVAHTKLPLYIQPVVSMCCYSWVPRACLATDLLFSESCPAGTMKVLPQFHSARNGRRCGCHVGHYLAVVPFLSFHLCVHKLVGWLHGISVWFRIARYHVV